MKLIFYFPFLFLEELDSSPEVTLPLIDFPAKSENVANISHNDSDGNNKVPESTGVDTQPQGNEFTFSILLKINISLILLTS